VLLFDWLRTRALCGVWLSCDLPLSLRSPSGADMRAVVCGLVVLAAAVACVLGEGSPSLNAESFKVRCVQRPHPSNRPDLSHPHQEATAAGVTFVKFFAPWW
jgi:hypothetical protein